MKCEIEHKLNIFFLCRYLFNYTIPHTLYLFVLLAFGATYSVAHEFLIPFDAEWRYHASEKKPQKKWNETDFDDSHWKLGVVGIGYGDKDDATILKNMRGKFTDVYIRHTFDLKKKPTDLYLYIRYDDAFTAYVNGKKLIKVGYQRGRVESHEADHLERFKLESKYLTVGRNVLAIKGENAELKSSDFSLYPALTDQPIIQSAYDTDEAFLQCNRNYGLNRNKKYKRRLRHCYATCYQGGVTKNTLDAKAYMESSKPVVRSNKEQYRFLDWRGGKVRKKVSKNNIETGFIRWESTKKASCKATQWRAVVRLKELEPTVRSQQIWDIVNVVLKSALKPSGGKMSVPGQERTDSIVFLYCAEEGDSVKTLAHSLNTLLDNHKKTQFLDKNLPAFLTKHEYVGMADNAGYPGHLHGAVLCHYTSSNLYAQPNMENSLLEARLKGIGYKGLKKISLPSCYPLSKKESCQKCKQKSICPMLDSFCDDCE